jgi:hypothetical protein
MPNTVTESIFNGGSAEAGTWANSIWISQPEAAQFTSAWCRYRGELEADTLADLSPQDH